MGDRLDTFVQRIDLFNQRRDRDFFFTRASMAGGAIEAGMSENLQRKFRLILAAPEL